MKLLGKRTSSIPVPGLDVSPLIDVVFILLLFFVLSSVFVNEVGLSAAGSTQNFASREHPDPLYLRIDEYGSVFYRDLPVPLQQVGALTRRELRKENPSVIIEAANGVWAGRLIEVMDSAREAGAVSIRVAAQNRRT